MKEKKYLSLSTEISESKDFSFDDSLIPVDIKVMHDGLNFNNSTFYDEAIEDAKESLKNKPILGYIRKSDGDDSSDFAGHEVELLLGDDGDVKYNYLERPLGVVPEANSYSIMEEDGKKFVHCRGYLWKEYLNSGYEILKNNPKKSVSMEIAVDDFGFNEDETVNIKKYRYLGITILGDDVPPAMAGAQMNVLGQFSKDEDKSLYKKIEDLNKKIEAHFSLSSEISEGGDKMKEEKTKVVKTEEDFVEEDVDTKEEDIDATQEATDAVVKAEESKLEADIDAARTLVNALEDVDKKEELTERLDAIVVEDGEETDEEADEDYELKYSELLIEFNELTEKFNELDVLANELKEFKATKDAEELEARELEIREEKIDYINENYPTLKEDVKEMFISKVDEYETVENIDADICVYIVKNKITFSKAKKVADNVKVAVEEEKTNKMMSPYGDLF